ncbi:MAG: GGDEF domain-containing protein [Oscillochloris sp.]|nr:GGDEF domain-containing protein [Oscillochloris sp.]
MIYIFSKPIFYEIPLLKQLTIIIVLSSNSIFTLFANYTLERDRRQSYLLRLRDRMRRAELTASNVELTKLSQIDPLTGIAHQRELNNYLDRLQQDSRLDRIGVVMCDVDRFKFYNDFYGYPAGDKCLSLKNRAHPGSSYVHIIDLSGLVVRQNPDHHLSPNHT